MADKQAASQSCGRGGRGALLAAALEKQQRRPGVAPPSSSDQDTSESRPVSSTTGGGSDSGSSDIVVPKGRAALLLNLGRGTTLATPVGRSTLLLAAGRSKPGLPSQPVGGRGSILRSIVTKPASPPREEIQSLTIEQPRGTDGSRCNLEVNYVRLKTKPNMGVFEYHVNFNPPVDSKSLRFQVMKCEAVKAVIGNTKSFDGAKLCLPIMLPAVMTDVKAELPTDNSSVMVHIKFVGKSQDLVQHYNVLIKRIMNKLQMTLVGRNYFDHRGGIEVPQHKLEVWPGYTTAIQEFEDGLMLNCDASFRVLRTNTARDLLVQCHTQRRENFKEEFTKKVVGTICLTRYNNKTYRIDDIKWDMTPMDKFQFHTGEEISYVDYYKRAYDITISDVKQPLLLHMEKPRGKEKDSAEKMPTRMICLIPELCNLTGLTDEMRADFKIMKDIAVHTRVTPNQRQLCLQKYIDNVNNTPEAKAVFAEWGVELDTRPMKINGRLLSREEIAVGRNVKFTVNSEADWGREMGREHVLNAVDINKWVIIFTKRDSGKAKDFAQMMVRVFPQMGVKVQQPEMRELVNDRTETYLIAAKNNINPSVQVLVFIMPTARDDRYNAVKKLCCVEMPIASQVVNARTIAQPPKLRSVSQKIALQINCKLGGELWALRIPMQKTMICGIDVCHDPSRKLKSVAGFVSSLNATYTRWYNVASFQDAGQELVDCLRVSLVSALRKYDEINHFLPDKIIIYRDGVGDGQLSHVRDYEIEQMKKAFVHFNGNYNPSLLTIIVQKRINTRLFLDLNGEERKLENPAPGTILDNTITRRNWFDFFLVSQHVRQGTVSPTHYIVVYNRSQLKADHIQKLSYKLTHLYYNWPGTVRVPAPCQYAHKLAYLCGQNIHKPASEILCDKLFFL